MILRLGKPYRNCYDSADTYQPLNNTLFNATIQYNGVYSQSICLEYCFQYYILNRCGCLGTNIQPDMNVQSADICSKIDEINCEYQGFVDFYEGSTGKLECLPMCPEECEVTEFETQLSFTRYSTNFLNYLANNPNVSSLIYEFYNTSEIDESLIKMSITTIYVYYDKLTYTLYNEAARMNINDLFSSIGGILGLLMGASILSILEIVVLILQILFCLCFKEKTTKTNENMFIQRV